MRSFLGHAASAPTGAAARSAVRQARRLPACFAATLAATQAGTMHEPPNPRPVITGKFMDRDSARQGFDEARNRGYAAEEIDVLMFSDKRSKHLGPVAGHTADFGNKALEGAGVGAAIGGGVGAIAALLTTVGTGLAVPGLDLVIAGPIAAALAGAGAGGAVGTLLGAIVGWTLPDEHVKKYEACLRDGGILLGVQPRNDDDARHLATHWGLQRSAQAPDPTQVGAGGGS